MVTFSCKSCHTHNCISSVKRGAGYTAVIPKRYQVKGLDHVVWPVSWQSEDAPKPRTLTTSSVFLLYHIASCWPLKLQYIQSFSSTLTNDSLLGLHCSAWRGKVKILHNLLFLLPLQLSLLLAKSGSRSLRKWGLKILGTGVYLTYPYPALCNCPAPANLLNHACPCTSGIPLPILTTVPVHAKSLSLDQRISS